MSPHGSRPRSLASSLIIGGALSARYFVSRIRQADSGLTETRKSLVETLEWLKAQTGNSISERVADHALKTVEDATAAIRETRARLDTATRSSDATNRRTSQCAV